jgi:hypothetical protein
MNQRRGRTNRGLPRRANAPLAACGLCLLIVACSSGKPFGTNDNDPVPEAGAAGQPGGEPGPRGGSGAAGGNDGSGGSGGSEVSLAGGGGEIDGGGAPSDPTPGDGGAGPVGCAPGLADCNGRSDDGCETPLDTASDCGRCGNGCIQVTAPECAKVDDEYSCVNPVQALTAQRVELKCFATLGTPELCETVEDKATHCPQAGNVVVHTFTMGGKADVVYDVTLRVRGVLEPKVYSGGSGSGNHFYVGGIPEPSNFNVYSLTVSSPAQTYFLNSADGSEEKYVVFALNHNKVIRVAGGATVKLGVEDPDCSEVRNCQSPTGTCTPFVIAGIAPAPSGFNGQFVQIDVVSVAIAK